VEELLKNDEFIQYIISTHLPANDMSYQEKIQSVFSSKEEFTTAMDCFKLSDDTVRKH